MPASIKHLTDKKISYNSLLAKWKDGLYYTAALTKCDRANKRCRVCFEDGSEVWISNRDLHIQLSVDQLNEDEDIVCCVCDDGNSEAPNEIILCDVCNQGYHQKCHQPPVDASKLDDSEETKDHKDWFCATCSYILNQTSRAKIGATVASSPERQPEKRQPPVTSSAAPSPPKQQPNKHQVTKAPTSPTVSQQQQASRSKQTAIADVNTRAAVTASTAAAVTTTTTVPSNVAPPTTKVIPTPTAATIPTKTTAPAATAPEIIHPSNNQVAVVKQSSSSKVKQTPISSAQHQPNQKANIGSIKPPVALHQRSAPYYPLSSQVRASVPTSSTAALASMTASSALVVGSSVGRSKQDLVKQSNKSSQRQMSSEPGSGGGVISAGPGLPKHAVRKSSVNFVVSQVKQSALPTATRSLPSTGGGGGGGGSGGVGVAAVNNAAVTSREPSSQMLSTTPHSSIAKPIITMTLPTSAPTVSSPSANASYTITALTSQAKGAEPKMIRNDTIECVNVVARTANGQPTNEQRSVISTINSTQQVSGLSLSKVIESNSKAASAGVAQIMMQHQKQRSAIDLPNSGASPSNSPPQRVESTTQQTNTPDSFNSTKSNTERKNDASANKPTTVIVGANIK